MRLLWTVLKLDHGKLFVEREMILGVFCPWFIPRAGVLSKTSYNLHRPDIARIYIELYTRKRQMFSSFMSAGLSGPVSSLFRDYNIL